MEEILKYFPEFTEQQITQLKALNELYRSWNEKINVISRKDIDMLYEHHVLHSLAIAKYFNPKPTTQILDLGTGGGFPGIPLAIALPHCRFKLIDGTGKKIRVAQVVIDEIGLTNAVAEQMRGEDEKGKFDFVVSRAVMPLTDLVKLVRKNINKTSRNALPNGIICLKGGDVQNEIAPYKKLAQVTSISEYFKEDWFKEKQIIYLPI